MRTSTCGWSWGIFALALAVAPATGDALLAPLGGGGHWTSKARLVRGGARSAPASSLEASAQASTASGEVASLLQDNAKLLNEKELAMAEKLATELGQSHLLVSHSRLAVQVRP
jgi:hypothetical protein